MTPDTNCAIRMPRSELLTNGYAMISGRAAQRANLLIVCRAAGRSTPIMGIARSTLSRRTIFFLLILLAPPVTAHFDSLEDSARELVGKIAASVPSAEGVSLEIRNYSSMSSNGFADVEHMLRNELGNRKIPVSTGVAASINLRITLSENVKGLLWSAEIIKADTSQVILVEGPRTLEIPIAFNPMPIVLVSKKFWEGQEKILDARVLSGMPGNNKIILLLPDELQIQDTPGKTTATIKFPPDGPATREPVGVLELMQDATTVTFPNRICDVDLKTMQLLECRAMLGSAHSIGDIGEVSEIPGNLAIPGRVSLVLRPDAGCGAGLTSSAVDDTLPDWVQALSSTGQGAPISNKVDFPGPVLALRGGSVGSVAIVRNLETGNYEAYSLSCGK